MKRLLQRPFRDDGFTLIEVVVFILIVGIAMSGFVTVYSHVLSKQRDPSRFLKASQLASARMEIIIQQSVVSGFASLTDPCTDPTPPDACTDLTAYATAQGLTVSCTFSPSTGINIATVNVTGNGDAALMTRFVQ